MGNGEKKHSSGLYNAVMWAIGADISSGLPYFVMIASWISDNCRDNIWTYCADYTDTMAFLYAAVLSFLLLCMDKSKHINDIIQGIGCAGSLLLLLITVLIYGIQTATRKEEERDLQKIIELIKTEKKFPQEENWDRAMSIWDQPSSMLHIATIVIALIVFLLGFILIWKNTSSNQKEIDSEK